MTPSDYDRGYDMAMEECAGSVQAMDAKLTNLQRILCEVIAASGGSVLVPNSSLSLGRYYKLTMVHDDAENGLRLSVKL